MSEINMSTNPCENILKEINSLLKYTILTIGLLILPITAKAEKENYAELYNLNSEEIYNEENLYSPDELSELYGNENDNQLRDPLEGLNRYTHEFNLAVDKTLVRPVAKVYKFVVPSLLRKGVSNFFSNIDEPFDAINNTLQGDTEGLGRNITRFFVNSTLGMLGIFDIASEFGIEPNHEDFGQTLAVWGVGDGGYIVLPILGPQTLRSTIAIVPSIFADPASLVIADIDIVHNHRELRKGVLPGSIRYAQAVNASAKYGPVIQDLEEKSLDFYSTVRSLYWQDRSNAINE